MININDTVEITQDMPSRMVKVGDKGIVISKSGGYSYRTGWNRWGNYHPVEAKIFTVVGRMFNVRVKYLKKCKKLSQYEKLTLTKLTTRV